MLLSSENDPRSKYKIYKPKNLIHHQDLILAVKTSLKPGLCNVVFKPFTKEMLTKYFCKLAEHSYVRTSKINYITDEELGKCNDC